MARTNVARPPKPPERTHEGAVAARIPSPLARLRRSVLACLLWENEFYEDGTSIATRIDEAAEQVTLQDLATLSVEARSSYSLRHAPLWLLRTLIRRASKEPRGEPGKVAPSLYGIVAETIAAVIQRADELTELVALYWKDGKRPFSAQMKKGLARAFQKFDAYQLAKYNRDNAVTLRDVLFLTHAKPKDEAQAALWKKLADGTLEAPDTWEVALSKGADKKETFERLLTEGKLGYLALLRNLRNMASAGVSTALIRDAIIARKGAHRVLPFRYVAAARAVPQFEPYLDQALVASIGEAPVLPGKTIVLVDVSGSMDEKLSAKSDLTRLDAAATLASVIPGDVRVFTFSDRIVEVAPRRGMAGVDAIVNSQSHSGTYLGAAISALMGQTVRVPTRSTYNVTTGMFERPVVSPIGRVEADRLIVITDEQSHDSVPAPHYARNYLINVASSRNGVGYGKAWTHLDGFSEQVIRWIIEFEKESAR